MNIVDPYTSTLADVSGNQISYLNTIVSTNAVDETYSEYSATATYIIGDYVKIGALKRVYQSKIDNNTDYPYGSPNWVDMGALNSYRMFDERIYTETTHTGGDLVVELDTSRATTLAILSVRGANTIRVVYTDTLQASVLSDVTYDMRDYGVLSMYDYAYKPFYDKSQLIVPLEFVPSSTVRITFHNANGDEIGVGAVVTGIEEYLGITLVDTSVGYKDYSVINTDEWGNTTLVRRGTASVIDAKMLVDTNYVDVALEALKRARAKQILFTAGECGKGIESLTTIGFVQDVTIPLSVSKSNYSIKIIGVI